jgi:hypothetical protein
MDVSSYSGFSSTYPLPMVSDESWRQYLSRMQVVPKRIIFNPPATIVYWNDGTKTVVKCSENEEFIPEVGLAMAFIRKLYPKRSEFLKFLESAYYQEKE